MPYKYVTQSSREIEKMLSNIGGEGKSIHELVSSIEDTLPVELVKKLRFLASVRNKLFHESGFELASEQFDSFKQAATEAINSLNDIEQQVLLKKSEIALLLCHHCNKPTKPLLVKEMSHVSHNQCAHCFEPLREFDFWSDSSELSIFAGKVKDRLKREFWSDSSEPSNFAGKVKDLLKRGFWFYLKVFAIQYCILSVLIIM